MERSNGGSVKRERSSKDGGKLGCMMFANSCYKLFCQKLYCHKFLLMRAKKIPAQGNPRTGIFFGRRWRSGRPCRAPPHQTKRLTAWPLAALPPPWPRPQLRPCPLYPRVQTGSVLWRKQARATVCAEAQTLSTATDNAPGNFILFYFNFNFLIFNFLVLFLFFLLFFLVFKARN